MPARVAFIFVCASHVCFSQTNAAFLYDTAADDFSARNYRAAAANFSKVIGEKPGCAEAYCFRGMSKWWLHDYSGAVADYDKAIALNPKCGGYYCNRGQARFSLKMVPEALADYNRAIELDPQNAQAYYNRGTLKSLCLTNYPDAVADFTKAIELHRDPQEEDIYFWRGDTRQKLGDHAGAIADYTRAIDLNPSNGCYTAKARTNLDAAIKLLRESQKK